MRRDHRAIGRTRGSCAFPSVAGRATRVLAVPGGVIGWLARRDVGCANGSGVPGEALAAERVHEVITVDLAGRTVEPEGIQRLALVGELTAAAIGPLDLAERAAEVAGGVRGGPTAHGYREPEAQTA